MLPNVGPCASTRLVWPRPKLRLDEIAKPFVLLAENVKATKGDELGVEIDQAVSGTWEDAVPALPAQKPRRDQQGQMAATYCR